MAKHSFEKQWPRWAGTIADLDALAQQAVTLAGGSLQIEVHRRGLGTSVFVTGSELAQGPTLPDLATVDRVAILVSRPRAQSLSRVAISFVPKLNAVTLEVEGSDQELVRGTLATLSHMIEAGVQFPASNPGLWQVLGILAFLAGGTGPAVAVVSVYGTRATTPAVLLAVLPDALLLWFATWLLTPFELLAPGSAPRLKRHWLLWVLPLVIGILGGGVWFAWPLLSRP